jgi:hypothetical protein
MQRKTPLRARTPLRQISDRRREKLAAQGITNPSSTLIPKPGKGNGWPTNGTFRPQRESLDRKPLANTGPKRSTVEMLKNRSGGVCEWPGCTRPATDKHHRLNRKQGGRHGVMRTLLNGVAWLLHACRPHHRRVTSPTGEVRDQVERMGWVLREHQDAVRVPVLTRHDPEPVWLDDAGSWHRYEGAAA